MEASKTNPPTTSPSAAAAEIPGYLGGLLITEYVQRRTAMQIYLLFSALSLLTFLYGARDPSSLETVLLCGVMGLKAITCLGFLAIYT